MYYKIRQKDNDTYLDIASYTSYYPAYFFSQHGETNSVFKSLGAARATITKILKCGKYDLENLEIIEYKLIKHATISAQNPKQPKQLKFKDITEAHVMVPINQNTEYESFVCRACMLTEKFIRDSNLITCKNKKKKLFNSMSHSV